MTAPVVARAIHDAVDDPGTWTDHQAAAAFVDDRLARARTRSAGLAELTDRIETETATHLVDWVDHLVVDTDDATLSELGWRLDAGTGLRRHPGAQLPALVAAPGGRSGDTTIVALRVDDLGRAAVALGAPAEGRGTPGAPVRTLDLGTDDGVGLLAVERSPYSTGNGDGDEHDLEPAAVAAAIERWCGRTVNGDADDALADALDRARTIAGIVGTARAADVVLAAERARWEARNHAARATRTAHDRFGLGWANRDHHTFRSSRVHFAGLLALFDILGFKRREQFHAGADAGWGAQVLEHPGNGEVVFADVDLSPDEVGTDLTIPLPAAPLGPVGTWCAVHGDSILTAGMHHLAARYRFDAWPTVHRGVDLQPPFSELEHLRQRFTAPEAWLVDVDRIRALVDAGDLRADAAERLTAGTVAGSHLEVVERRRGFKGFNQRSVSTTITANDLR